MRRSRVYALAGVVSVAAAGLGYAAAKQLSRLELDDYADYYDVQVDDATLTCALSRNPQGQATFAEATLKLPSPSPLATLGAHAEATLVAYDDARESALPPEELCWAIEDFKAEAAANGGKARVLMRKELSYDKEPGSYGAYCHRALRELITVNLPRGVVLVSGFQHQLSSTPLSDCRGG